MRDRDSSGMRIARYARDHRDVSVHARMAIPSQSGRIKDKRDQKVFIGESKPTDQVLEGWIVFV